MESFSSLLKKEHMGELVLIILFVVYLILGLKTPEPVASMVDSLVGKIVIFVVVIYLFMNTHPVLAVLSLFVAFDLMRRSSVATGIDALKKFAPSEEKKMSQFTAYNQFPYTLEQEVVSKMAPIMKSGHSLTQSSFKPLVDDTYDASPLSI
jgi:fumarate reductase subunit D